MTNTNTNTTTYDADQDMPLPYALVGRLVRIFSEATGEIWEGILAGWDEDSLFLTRPLADHIAPTDVAVFATVTTVYRVSGPTVEPLTRF